MAKGRGVREGRGAERERSRITGERGPVEGEARVGNRQGYMSKGQCEKYMHENVIMAGRGGAHL